VDVRWLVTLLLLSLLMLFVAVCETIEYVHQWGARNSPMAEGEIVGRGRGVSFGFLPRVKLKIRLRESDTYVYAITNRPDAEAFAGPVRFRYTNDPSREVFIEGEEEPLWVALFLYAMLVLFWTAYLVVSQGQKKIRPEDSIKITRIGTA
jgi:hypothetical protein